MNKTTVKAIRNAVRGMPALVVSLAVMLAMSMTAQADEADAKRLLNAMSDYLVAQRTISFEYDATLEIVTPDEQ